MPINQSLAHGLDILFRYDDTHSSFTVSEISKRLEYTQNKTYRLVRTLIKYSLLQEGSRPAPYCLGINSLRLGLLTQKQFNISIIAQPIMMVEEYAQKISSYLGYDSKITTHKG
jgi:DNA-binding IclR family transcriptional regulator